MRTSIVRGTNLDIIRSHDINVNDCSFGDISTDSLSFDTVRMACGYGVMFVYVILMLGKLNRVEHRTYLAIAGLVAVLFGIVISMGMAFQLGYFYTPLHGLLPFLALGMRML